MSSQNCPRQDSPRPPPTPPRVPRGSGGQNEGGRTRKLQDDLGASSRLPSFARPSQAAEGEARDAMGPPEMATHRAPIIDKPISEEPTKPYRATTINPITLSFADPEMEMELRAGIVDVAQPVVALFLVLNLVLNMLAGYQTTLVHIILFATYGCAVLHPPRARARASFDALGREPFWVLVDDEYLRVVGDAWSGMIRRLNRDEGQQAAACCAI